MQRKLEQIMKFIVLGALKIRMIKIVSSWEDKGNTVQHEALYDIMSNELTISNDINLKEIVC